MIQTTKHRPLWKEVKLVIHGKYIDFIFDTVMECLNLLQGRCSKCCDPPSELVWG